jgi:hypothetical protein
MDSRPDWAKRDFISTKKLSMVVHTCNSNYTGNISRRIIILAGLGRKCETLPEK